MTMFGNHGETFNVGICAVVICNYLFEESVLSTHKAQTQSIPVMLHSGALLLHGIPNFSPCYLLTN